MGDDIYTSFWSSSIQKIIDHFERGETKFMISVAGLSQFGDRKSYYSKFKIVKGQLDISNNAYAQGRDFHTVLVSTDYFKSNLSESVISILITKDLQMEVEIENASAPEFFTQKDFDMLAKYAGKSADRNNSQIDDAYQYLKRTYEKVDYWASNVCRRVFAGAGQSNITRKPTNQANNFEAYQWAKIYPTAELLEWKNLAYTLTFSTSEYFCVKIDTVRLGDNDPLRKKYLSYRGEFLNSPIVKFMTPEEILPTNWGVLIERSATIVRQLGSDYNKLLNLLGYSNLLSSQTTQADEQNSLNTILYGPPGTGKTFSLQTNYISRFTLTSISKSREEHLIEVIEDLSWWQVIALTLSEMRVASVPEMLNHEYVKIKSGLSRSKKVLNTIWQQLQAHTVVDSKTVNVAGRTHPNIFDKTVESKWFVVQEKLATAPELDDYLTAIKSYEKGNKVVQRNYSFITFHQSFSYEDFIEGIKPSVEEDQDDVKYEIKKGVFYHACEKAVQLAGYSSIKDCLDDNKESRREKLRAAKPYGFFIDEINRANISAVFGELITLIEDDKRLGGENEISDVILPYSRTGFGVPSNLQIIGTMNTADRSVEALDTALRRRFGFIETRPNAAVLTEVINGVSLGELLSIINDRIEILLDKDHQIGHSFFISVKNEHQLLLVFYNKIIPLLQEFFYGDYAKIGLILDKGFVRAKTLNRSLAFSNDFEIRSELNDKRIYEIVDYRKETGFLVALQLLLQNKKSN